MNVEIRTPTAVTILTKPGLVDVFHSDGFRETTVRDLEGKRPVTITPTTPSFKPVTLAEGQLVRVRADLVGQVEWE